MCMSTRRDDAMQPGIAHVPSHLGVKLAATPARPGALDHQQLLAVEGSKNPKNRAHEKNPRKRAS